MDTDWLAATDFRGRMVLPSAMAIYGVSARSRLGQGIAPIIRALAQPGSMPLEGVAPIEDFDIRAEIGVKGTRTLDRATGLALSAVDSLMAGSPLVMRVQDIALVLGTTMGSVSSTIRFTQDGLTGSRPYLVDPSKFPNTVMNFAAGQTAIRHRLTGPNVTIIAGAVTGLASLRYGARLMRGGQSTHAIVGATEELTKERKAIHEAGAASRTVLGEGSAMLLLGPADEVGDATAGRTLVLGILTGFAVPEKRLDMLKILLDRANRLSAGKRGPSLVAVSASPPEADLLIERVSAQTGRSDFDIANVATVLGDTGAVSAIYGLGVCSDILRHGHYGLGATAWVLAVDPSGYMGIAVLQAPVSPHVSAKTDV